MTVPKGCGMCGGKKKVAPPETSEKLEVLNGYSKNARIMHYVNRNDLSVDQRLSIIKAIMMTSPHFKCVYCNEIFTRFSTYQSHINQFHPEITQQPMKLDDV